MRDAMERNLRLYRIYVILSRGSFWAPIFFLYLNERFPVDRILFLHALYYATVVVLEVPSGYLSDRVSRTLTLRLSALAAVGAYAIFVSGGDQLGLFVVAHGLQAVFYSFLSGTDASLHFDTLASLGRGHEFAEREARMGRDGFLAASVFAMVGGVAGMWDLRIPYALSLGSGLLLLGVCLALREPHREADGYGHAHFGSQLRACFGYLRSPFLLWIFAYMVLQVTLEHVPYEFAQPYAAAALGEQVQHVRRTPLVMGVIAAAIAAVGAWASSQSARLGDRFGIAPTLVGATAVQTGLITIMAATVHVAVLPLVALRSCQGAVGTVLVRAAVAPRVAQAQRATYLSIHSLAGRLGYASVLLLLGSILASEGPDAPLAFRQGLRVCAVLALFGLAALALTLRRTRE